MERIAVVNVQQLARTYLSGSTAIRHVPNVPASEFHEAVARYGGGIDHVAGEVPLALVKAKLDAQAARARDYSATYVVTDRRLFGRVEASNIPRHLVEVPYAYVSGVPAKPGALAQSILVPLGPQQRKLYLAPKQLHAYFAAVAGTLAPAQRTFGPRPSPVRTPQDPIGAWTAAQSVGTPDPRTWVPLRVLFEAHRRGELDTDAAAALVPPLIQLACGVAYGRDSTPQGAWRTTLPQTAIGPALHAILGAPLAVLPAQDGEIHDFAIGAGPGAGAAVASTLVGVAALATLGVGWITTSHGHRLATLRVHTNHNTFHLFGTSGAGWDPLSLHWWRAVDAIHQALFRLEARYLLGQAAFGAQLSARELLTLPREHLEPRVAQLIGPTSLDGFYPKA